MTTSLRFLLALSMGILIGTPVRARAEPGRITFSGRIVEATCTTPETTLTGMRVGGSPRRMTCKSAAGDQPARGYSLSLIRLTGNASDPVVHYFETYVKAANPGAAKPVLLTKVYE